MAREYIPGVSQELISFLRATRRDWQDKLPEADWSWDQIQRSIGANEVISFLEELHAQTMGLISDPG